MDFKPVDLTICQIDIRFGENVYPKETYASLSFGHDPMKTVAMAAIFVWIFTFFSYFVTDNTRKDYNNSIFSIISSNVLMNDITHRPISFHSEDQTSLNLLV